MQSLSHGEYSPNPLAEDRGGVGGGTGMTRSHELRCWSFQNLKNAAVLLFEVAFSLPFLCHQFWKRGLRDGRDSRIWMGDHDATSGFRCLKVRYCTLHLPFSAFSLGTLKKAGEADTWDNPSSKVIECQQHGKPCAKGQTLPDSLLLKVEDSRRFSKLKKAPRRNTFPSFTQFQCSRKAFFKKKGKLLSQPVMFLKLVHTFNQLAGIWSSGWDSGQMASEVWLER